MSAATQTWGQLPVYHAKTALRVWNLLSANAANLFAHVAVHHAPDKWHLRDSIHPIANEKTRSRCRGCCRHKPINFFRKMLTIGIEKDCPLDFPTQSVGRLTRFSEPVRQARFDRFALAAVFRVNNDFSAGFARAF